MKIEDLIKLAGLLEQPAAAPDDSIVVGEAYFFRTVTFAFTGRVTRVTDKFIHIADAAWIADTGRFNEFMRSGVVSEVEPYPCDTMVAVASLIDVAPWPHPLPRETK